MLGSWKRLPTNGAAIGKLGASSSKQLLPLSLPAFKASHTLTGSASWQPSPNMFGLEDAQRPTGKFAPKRSKWRFEPSPRPSNWLENRTPWLTKKDATTNHSNNNSRASADPTLLPSPNLPSL